jgi:hypothetical protein
VNYKIKRTVIWLATINVLASLTTASHATDITDAASYCFNPPYGVNDFAVTLDVLLDKKGIPTAIKVRDGYRPDKETVLAASRAVESCSPYEANGSVTAEFTPESIESKKLDPFK